MPRKLARIETVDAIVPIEGADAIEVAKVGGWQVVVKKGEFTQGSRAVWFEIDSFLPDRPQFEFLRERCFKVMEGRGGFKLRTIKLRKTLSQGLLLPIMEFRNYEFNNSLKYEYFERFESGKDVTGLLGVVLWEPPLPPRLAGNAKGGFPAHTPKTDEERIQNLKGKDLEPLLDLYYEETLKLDGSSMTSYLTAPALDPDGGPAVFGVCSRNLDLKEDEGNSFWAAARKFKIEERMRAAELFGYSLQGELMGPGIQGNKEGFESLEFFLFRIWDHYNKWELPAHDRLSLLKLLNTYCPEAPPIQHVPIVNPKIQLFREIGDCEKILEYVKGPSLKYKHREGSVFKALSHDAAGHVHHFKAINNDFLLGEKD